MKNYVICYGLISDEYRKFPLSITDPLVTANEILHFPHEVERFGTNNELNLQLFATMYFKQVLALMLNWLLENDNGKLFICMRHDKVLCQPYPT